MLGRILKKLIRKEERKRAEQVIKHKDFWVGDDVKFHNTNLSIGKGTKIYDHVIFWGGGEIEIGKNVSIGYNTIIFSNKGGKVVIGDHSQIAANCYIINMDHSIEPGKTIAESANVVEDVLIGNNVWIGANATVLKGSTIGDNSIVGANALVNRSIDKDCVAVGVPARIVKTKEG